MKQIIGLLMLLIMGAYSCDKLPKNDDLDGMWHLQEVTNLSTTPEQVENVAEGGIYWNVNLDLLQIYSKKRVMYHDEATGKDVYHAYCRFEYSGACLYILEISCLSVASFAIIFSHSEGCLFTLLIVSFVVLLS